LVTIHIVERAKPRVPRFFIGYREAPGTFNAWGQAEHKTPRDFGPSFYSRVNTITLATIPPRQINFHYRKRPLPMHARRFNKKWVRGH